MSKRYKLRKKKPGVKYAGSCVQQNHGEDISGHGMLVWNVSGRDAEFVEIENDYGYYTLEVVNGRVPDVSDMPKNPRLRVKITNTDAADVQRVLTDIRKKYNVSEFTIIRDDALSETKLNHNNSDIRYDDIQNVEHQNGLIKDYLVRNYPDVDDEIIQQAQTINRELNADISNEELVRNIRWKPKRFEFSNMFSYGENNLIEFSSMNDILGLFAENASGKSSVFDALLFCIFDKCNRTYKADYILNNRSEEFWCKFNFEINGVDYYIEKTGKPYKYRDSIKVEINFWKVEDGEKISLNGEHRRDTTSTIRKYLGTYDDFIFTCLSLQGNNTIFSELSQSERKDLLAQSMGLNIFDKLHNAAQNEIKETSTLVRKFKKKDYSKELSELEQNYESYKNELTDKRDRLGDINDELSVIDNQLEKRYNNLYSVSTDIDINELTENKEKIKDELNSLSEKKSGLDTDKTKWQIEVENLKNELLSYDGVEDEKKQYDENKKIYDDVVNEIERHKVKVQHTIKRFNSIKESLDLEINEDCSACVANAERFNKEYKEVLEELNGQKSYADDLVEKKKKYDGSFDDYTLDKYNNFVELKDEINDLDDKIKTVKYKINNIQSDIQSKNNNLKSVIDNIEKYYENEEKIKENIKIQKEIDSFKYDKNKLKSEKDNLENDKSNLLKDIGSAESRIETINEEIKEGKQLEQRLDTYEYYLDAVKRDGIPYELISRAIPVIQGEINNILRQIVEFTMNIVVDGKNIDVKIVYQDEEWPLELASGMEKFISGLAIRVALMKISNLPRPNFLSIDEGFGTLDADNLNSLSLLFDYLRTQFKFIIIISHLETMRDVVDDFIEIKQDDDNFSNITYS